MSKNWDTPPPDFKYVLFERVEREANVNRFYYIGYLHTLIGPAVVRLWGRKGGHQHSVAPARFDSLEDAWPTVRKHIKSRLRKGYRVVEPDRFK